MIIKKQPASARQKMINLMYVILMAFLAINVSPEVLGGFEIIQKSLKKAADDSTKENDILFEEFKKQMKMNPAKIERWSTKAGQIRSASDYLYNHIENIKKNLAKEAGQKDGDYLNIENKEDVEAVKQVLLRKKEAITSATTLKAEMESYANLITLLVDNPSLAQSLKKELATEFPDNAQAGSWEDYMFDGKPVISAITVLTKIQSDIRFTENKVMHLLAENLEKDEIGSNRAQAFVLPESRTVFRGNSYKARIILAATDTTAEPRVFLQGANGNVKELESNSIEQYCAQTGTFTVKGYVSVLDKSGNWVRNPFQQDYTVIEPTATISSDLMNVLYIGYENAISVSVPGIRPQDIAASMEGGTIKPVSPGRYMAKPNNAKGAIIRVWVKNNGKNQAVREQTFRTRRLPDPAPYISLGNTRFHGGRIGKKELIQANGIRAAVDDGILDVPFKVLSFDMILLDNIGNAFTSSSDGDTFSDNQRKQLNGMSKGQRAFITHIKVMGPDKTEREIKNTMEVLIR